MGQRRMTDAEHAEIERLAHTLRNPTPSAVARRIGRHPATVYWHMLRRGLTSIDPAKGRNRNPYVRRGVAINPWLPMHDDRAVELDIAGKKTREIAEILTREFGVPRNAHMVYVRLVMLATVKDEASE